MATRRAKKKVMASSSALESTLGLTFRKPKLLELALTHSSFANESRAATEVAEPGTDNEQMEFVGDAVLGLLVTEALYEEFPQCDEGQLTRLRSSLVNRPRLAEVAEAIGLGEHLRLGRSAQLSGVHRKSAVLADTVEAVIAAVYLDSGLKAARSIVERFIIGPQRDSLHLALEGERADVAFRDAKSLLQERVQASGAGRLRYIDTEQSGPAHQLCFTVEARIETGDDVRVLASADGPSKKEAQQLAARKALDSWTDEASCDHEERV